MIPVVAMADAEVRAKSAAAASGAGEVAAEAAGGDAPVVVERPTSPAAGTVLERVATGVQEVVEAVTEYAVTHVPKESRDGAKALLANATSSAEAAVAYVRSLAKELRAVPATELPLIPIYEALHTAKLALSILLDAANKFDEKYHLSTSLMSVVEGAKSAANRAIVDGRARVEALVGKRTTDSAETEATAVRASAAGLITTSLAKSQQALEDLLSRVLEYDRVTAAKTTAASVLAGAMKATEAASAELRRVTESVRKTPARELPKAAVAAALDHATTAVATLTEKARAYDADYKVSESVTSAIDVAQARASAAVAEARSQLEAFSGNASTVAAAAADAALKRLLAIDQAYGVSAVAGSIVSTAALHVTALDEKYGITPAAAALDERYTGGMGAVAVAKATEVVGSTISAVTAHIASLDTSGEAAALEDDSATPAVDASKDE